MGGVFTSLASLAHFVHAGLCPGGFGAVGCAQEG